MSKLYLSYSSLADIYALEIEHIEQGDEETARALGALAADLEQLGIGEFQGETYYLLDNYGRDEVVSEEDFLLEHEGELI